VRRLTLQETLFGMVEGKEYLFYKDNVLGFKAKFTGYFRIKNNQWIRASFDKALSKAIYNPLIDEYSMLLTGDDNYYFAVED
jgi:hypothetical protein